MVTTTHNVHLCSERKMNSSAGTGGDRPLLFVIANPSFLVIASPDLSGRGNLARVQGSLKVIIEPQR